jgi:hypothetical protein
MPMDQYDSLSEYTYISYQAFLDAQETPYWAALQRDSDFFM